MTTRAPAVAGQPVPAAPTRVAANALEIAFWLVPVVVAVITFRHPIGFVDLAWQIALGQEALRHGPLLHEPFVLGHLGEALVPNAWLAQIVYARLYAWGGVALLRAVDAAFWLSGPLFAAAAARGNGAGPAALLYALAAGYTLAEPSGLLRPQSFAACGFGLTLLLMHRLHAAPSWRLALGCGLPLFVVWQNLHPSVGLAALCGVAVAAGQWGGFVADRGRHGIDRPIAFSVLALAAMGAVLATPAGLTIIPFARVNTFASLASGASEWLPLWDPYHRMSLYAVLATTGLAVLVAVRARRTIGMVDILPWLIALAMTLIAVRFILFYAIAIVPLLARLDIRGASAPLRRRGMAMRHGLVVAVVVALSLAMPCAEQFRDVSAALIGKAAPGNVFSDPLLGGAITLDGGGRWPVAYDSRFYLYRPFEIELLRRTANDPGSLPDIERLYHPTAFALRKARSPALIGLLQSRPGEWRCIFSNDNAIVFVRRRVA